MTRRILLLVALATVIATGAWAQTSDERVQATELVREAGELIEAGDRDGAMQRLTQARQLYPDYPDLHAQMGYLHELQGEPLQALASYGRLLELRPDDEYARERIPHLFFGAQFPRKLRLELLQFSPVSFVADECRMRLGMGLDELTQRIAYTRGAIYPEDMPDRGAPVQVEIPSAGGQGLAGTARFNRVCYGFSGAVTGEDLTMAATVSYPSPLLSGFQADYSGLVERLMHIALRMHSYSRGCYGLPQQGSGDGIARVWMCESGPTGAEQYEDNIFLYDVSRDRRPVEWLREIAHEWGHYALPRMGRFTSPEPYASGMLGEALFLQLLADEAGMVTGEPWPSQRAQDAVTALWGGGEVALADHLMQLRHETLDLWLARGPNSELAAGLGEESFRYLVGALLWIDAAHGHDMLRATLLKAPGESPADFYYGYRQALREASGRGEITLLPGGLDLGRSKLAEPPIEGAVRRENVRLAPGDRAQFPVYLLEGPATVRALFTAFPGDVNLYVDGLGPLPLGRGVEPLSLGQREPGWHTLTVEVPRDGEPMTLQGLALETGESDIPAPGL